MNAAADSLPVNPAPARRTPAHKTHRFALLLRREFWEHKGGFFWAPMVAGGILVLLALMAIIGLEVARIRFADHEVSIDGTSVTIGALDLNMLTSKVRPEDMKHLGDAVDMTLLMAAGVPLIVLAFVVFFYCLGALYDERKDRSVLFWKSLPVSDAETVVSKVASAGVVAPLLALAAGIVTMFGLLLLLSILALAHGGNPVKLLWGPSSPLTIAAQLAASIPVYAIWALPTVGWLLLCSAWSRSKPFLWAIMIPLFAGIFVSWFDIMQLFNLDSSWYWKNIFGRALFSTVPGSDLFYRAGDFVVADDSMERFRQLLSVRVTYGALLQPQAWIGAIAGAAMIFGAIRLRRWRDEG